ncbi:hypothetical protein [Streptomyces scabiei]|nr:hypothetical protein [Streptomyces sp. LBUM 1481]
MAAVPAAAAAGEIRRGDTVVVLMDCSEEEIERAVRALDAAARDEGGGR